MLERRRATESWDDFKARFAEGLLIVSAYDTRAALVVCDQFRTSRRRRSSSTAKASCDVRIS
jgi:hypothetical protein